MPEKRNPTVQELMNVRVDVMLKEPTYTRADDGALVFMADHSGWTELALKATDECGHTETACTDCTETWGLDYWVRLRTPDGRAFGLNGVPGIPSL